MQRAEQPRRITAILPPDVDVAHIVQLLDEGHPDVFVYRYQGRGVGRTTARSGQHALIPERRQILSLVVPSSQADQMFDWLLAQANVVRPGGGLVFMEVMAAAAAVNAADSQENTE